MHGVLFTGSWTCIVSKKNWKILFRSAV